MANSYRNGAYGPTGILRITSLVAKLSRSVALLAADIEAEEMRTRNRNLIDPKYSTLAWSLRTRRDNLLATINSLDALIRELPQAA